MTSTTLAMRPVNRTTALAFVGTHHRHNRRAVAGWKFGVGLFDGPMLVGVGIAGRPTSRVLQARGRGHFLEITRVTTLGTPNGCTQLYGALIRAAVALGYCRAYTYTQGEEPGTSLYASGWEHDSYRFRLDGWDTPARERDNEGWPPGARIRWVRALNRCDVHA